MGSVCQKWILGPQGKTQTIKQGMSGSIGGIEAGMLVIGPQGDCHVRKGWQVDTKRNAVWMVGYQVRQMVSCNHFSADKGACQVY